MAKKPIKKTDKEEVEDKVLASMEEGEKDAEGGDAELAERLNNKIDELDPSVVANMKTADEAFTAVGLPKTSPAMNELWSRLDPEDRLSIFDAINNSAGMASDEQIAAEVEGEAARKPLRNMRDLESEEDAQMDLLRMMGAQ